MIESYIKIFYERKIVSPIAKRLAFINPNFITLLALVIGLSAALSAWLEHPYIAVILMFLSGYCDSLDGVLARLINRTTIQGAVLDIVCDRVVEFVLILSIFSINPQERALLSLFMLGSSYICVTTFLVVGIFAQKSSEKSFYYSPGLMERFEAFLVFALIFIFPQWFTILASTYTVLVLGTALKRIWDFHFSLLSNQNSS